MTSVSRFRAAWQRTVSVVLEIASTASANLLIIFISFAASLLAARLLGPEQRGLLAAAVVYVALATALADAGLSQAVPYFAARHKPEAPSVLGTSVCAALALGSLIAIVTFWVLQTIGVASPALLYLPSIPFALVTTHLAAFLYGGGLLTRFNIIRTLQAALLLAALLGSMLVGRPEVGLVLTVAVTLSAVLAIATVVVVGHSVPVSQWTVNRPLARRLLGYGLKSHLGNLCWLVNSRLDQLMMSLMLSAASLGVYATGASYAGVVFSSFGAFAMLTFAKSAAVPERDVFTVVRKYSVVSLTFGIPLTVVLILAAPWLFPLLFGAAFESGVLPAAVLCAASVFLGLNYVLSNGLRILNRPLLPSAAEAGGLVVSVIGLTWVLPKWGIIGASVVSLVSYATVFGTLLHFTHKIASSAGGRRHAADLTD